MFKFIVLVLAVFVVSSSCSLDKEQELHKVLLQGIWKGTASYKQISEIKVYSSLLEDSLIQLMDSMIVTQNVMLDIAKQESRFWNIKPISSSIYVYGCEKNKLSFKKKEEGIKIVRDTSDVIISGTVFVDSPSAIITKLDSDSLVLQLEVYKDGWSEYTLRLKRE